MSAQEWHSGGEFKKCVLPFSQDDAGEQKHRGEAVTTHQMLLWRGNCGC